MSFNIWKQATKVFGPGDPPTQPETQRSGKMPPNYLSEEEAKKGILDGQPPAGLWTYKLRFDREPRLVSLPPRLQVSSLTVQSCPEFKSLPEDLWATSVTITDCPGFGSVPPTASADHLNVEGCGKLRFVKGCALGDVRINRCRQIEIEDFVRFSSLEMRESALERLTSRVIVNDELDLAGSRSLTQLPEGLRTQRVIVRNCSSLKQLPDRLEAMEIDVSGCTRLRWQDDALVEARRLNLADCPQINTLPCWLISTESIDVANTGLTGLPEGFRQCQLFWRGVPVDQRIAFHPEQIQASEILTERNAEVRRVMLERVGWERFINEAKPKIRHQDSDPGGERNLLYFPVQNDENLVVLSVKCPSTGRNYFLRVPPDTQTCHQAAAWVAGFNDPDQYDPVAET